MFSGQIGRSAKVKARRSNELVRNTGASYPQTTAFSFPEPYLCPQGSPAPGKSSIIGDTIMIITGLTCPLAHWRPQVAGAREEDRARRARHTSNNGLEYVSFWK